MSHTISTTESLTGCTTKGGSQQSSELVKKITDSTIEITTKKTTDNMTDESESIAKKTTESTIQQRIRVPKKKTTMSTAKPSRVLLPKKTNTTESTAISMTGCIVKKTTDSSTEGNAKKTTKSIAKETTHGKANKTIESTINDTINSVIKKVTECMAEKRIESTINSVVKKVNESISNEAIKNTINSVIKKVTGSATADITTKTTKSIAQPRVRLRNGTTDSMTNSITVLKRTEIIAKKKRKKRTRQPDSAPIKFYYDGRLSLDERVRIIRYYDYFYGNVKLVTRVWQKEFKKRPPSETAIKAVYKKFDETGSVLNLPKPPGSNLRKSTITEYQAKCVKEACLKDPRRSIRSLCEEFGLNTYKVLTIKRVYNIPGKGRTVVPIKKLKEKLIEVEKQIDLLEEKEPQSTISSIVSEVPSKTINIRNDQSDTVRMAQSKSILWNQKNEQSKTVFMAKDKSKTGSIKKDRLKPGRKKKSDLLPFNMKNSIARTFFTQRRPGRPRKNSKKIECRPRRKAMPCLFTLTKEERIRMVHYYSQYDRIDQMRQVWKKKYGTPPRPQTFVLVNKKFDQFGNIANLEKARVHDIRVNRQERIDKIRNVLKKDPTRSYASIAKEVGLSIDETYRIKKAFRLPKTKPLRREISQLKKKVAKAEFKLAKLQGQCPQLRANRAALRAKARAKLAANKTDENLTPNTSAKSIRDKIALFSYPVSLVTENTYSTLTQGSVKQQEEQPSMLEVKQDSPTMTWSYDETDEVIEEVTLDPPVQEEDPNRLKSREEPIFTMMDIDEIDEQELDELELYELTQEEFDQLNTQGSEMMED